MKALVFEKTGKPGYIEKNEARKPLDPLCVLTKLSLFLQASKKQLECVVFEKDELSLSLKSLQEEHNKILQQNEVTVVCKLINKFCC